MWLFHVFPDGCNNVNNMNSNNNRFTVFNHQAVAADAFLIKRHQRSTTNHQASWETFDRLLKLFPKLHFISSRHPQSYRTITNNAILFWIKSRYAVTAIKNRIITIITDE